MLRVVGVGFTLVALESIGFHSLGLAASGVEVVVFRGAVAGGCTLTGCHGVTMVVVVFIGAVAGGCTLAGCQGVTMVVVVVFTGVVAGSCLLAGCQGVIDGVVAEGSWANCSEANFGPAGLAGCGAVVMAAAGR